MKIIVLGSAGYIGSALVDFLSRSYTTHGVDIIYGQDYRELSKEYLSGFDAVVLLAGLSTVSSCTQDFAKPFDQNVTRFVELFEKLTNQKLIYASSSSVYGGFSRSRQSMESDCVCSPLAIYDATKMMIDIAAQVSGKEYYGLRLGTVCGPSSNIRSTVLNAMVKAALTTGTINVVNKDVHRPILCLHDLCRAIKSIIEGSDQRGIYNLASWNTTVGKLAEQVQEYLAPKKEIQLHYINETVVYDFSINSSKFRANYDFTFAGAPQDLIKRLVKHYESIL